MSADFLSRWHQMVEQRDASVLAPLIAEEAQLHSPAFWRPKTGRAAVLAIFGAVMTVLEDFHYQGEWVEGSDIVLLFEGQLEGKTVRGIDRIRLNEEGQLTEIEIFVRPLSGLTVLAEKMGQALTR